MNKKVLSIVLSIMLLVGGLSVFSMFAGAAAYEQGAIITFGSYPQTHVDDAALIAELEPLAEALSWEPMGYTASSDTEYAFYKDVSYEGTMYRAIRFTRYNNPGPQIRYGYRTNTVYWFRYEPIEWTVLDPDSGLLIANAIIDTQPFSYNNYNGQYADEEHLYYVNNYAHSTIRGWLNGIFAENAFSDEEAELLILREQDNGFDRPEDADAPFARFACENTSDNVFLLSFYEVLEDTWFPDDASRIRVGTNYARALGLENFHDQDPVLYPDNDYWFLRSPGGLSTNQGYVDLNGAVTYGIDTVSYDVGVCPAVYIDLEAYEQLNAPDDPTSSPYDTLTFEYEDGILFVSGTGEIPEVTEIGDTPLAPFAEECKVIVIADGVTGIQKNAFRGFTQLNTLILNADLTLDADAFAENDSLQTVICSETVQFDAAVFSDDCEITIYEPKNTPHTGTLAEGCTVFPFRFEDGTLYIEGNAEMDMYGLLDLMTVMCSYYDNIRFVHFDSYVSVDVPFYVYNKKEEAYVPADDNTLTDVSFSIKVSGEKDWDAITFNEFCALAGSHELGTFHLVADLETGEEVQESAFQIMMNNIQIGIRKVLKWIVGLLNALFKLLSIFK